MIVDVQNGADLSVSIFLGERVFSVCWRLERPIERTVVGVRGSTVEVTMHKRERGARWQQLSLAGEECTTSVRDREPLYREGTLVAVEEVTHNTRLFTFRLPAGSYMSVPVGHHVKLRGMLEGGYSTRTPCQAHRTPPHTLPSHSHSHTGEEVVRSYTPVSLLSPDPSPCGPVQCDTLQLMVKLYSDGRMSQVLSSLKVGGSLLIGEPEGDFVWSTVRAKRLYLVAAGSGEWEGREGRGHLV